MPASRHLHGIAVAARVAALAACLVVAPASARAQLHTDASAQVGLEKRFLSSRAPGVPDASPGLRAEVRGHVALFPFVRLGAYGAYAFAPQSGAGRNMASLGLHARVLSPIPRTQVFSLWLSVGAGYGRTFVSGLGGGFVELPVGIGAGFKLRKPISLFAEAQSVFGVGHHGSAYSQGSGTDTVALSLALGAMVDF